MIKPDFSFEKRIWQKGFKNIAGLDEAGRGAFAGPVVCGCVVFDKKILSKTRNIKVRIDDSKHLTKLQREKSFEWIKKEALAWGVGVGTISEINRKGIVKSTASGFRRAVSMVKNKGFCRVDFLLIDAFYVPYIRNIRMPSKKVRKQSRDSNNQKITRSQKQQLAIIHGDEKSFSIAAASIVAKVYRDKLMLILSQNPRYKKYAWEKNKGYGTKTHGVAIKKHGISKHHRKKFVETFLANSKSKS